MNWPSSTRCLVDHGAVGCRDLRVGEVALGPGDARPRGCNGRLRLVDAGGLAQRLCIRQGQLGAGERLPGLGQGQLVIGAVDAKERLTGFDHDAGLEFRRLPEDAPGDLRGQLELPPGGDVAVGDNGDRHGAEADGFHFDQGRRRGDVARLQLGPALDHEHGDGGGDGEDEQGPC